MSAQHSGTPMSPREWRERGVRSASHGRWNAVRVLYVATALVVAVVLGILLVASWFPGTPEIPDAACGAPGAAGCTPGSTWMFMAVILGGPLAGVLLLCAVTGHVLRAVSGWLATRGGR